MLEETSPASVLILDSGLQTRVIVNVCSSWPSSLSLSIPAAVGQTAPLPGSQRHRLTEAQAGHSSQGLRG